MGSKSDNFSCITWKDNTHNKTYRWRNWYVPCGCIHAHSTGIGNKSNKKNKQWEPPKSHICHLVQETKTGHQPSLHWSTVITRAASATKICITPIQNSLTNLTFDVNAAKFILLSRNVNHEEFQYQRDTENYKSKKLNWVNSIGGDTCSTVN